MSAKQTQKGHGQKSKSTHPVVKMTKPEPDKKNEVPKFDTPYVTVKISPAHVDFIDQFFLTMSDQGYKFVTQINTSAFSRDLYFLFEKKE